jgi:putative sterol carrier protein
MNGLSIEGVPISRSAAIVGYGAYDSMTDPEAIEAALDGDDEQVLEALPGTLDGAAADVEALLADHPDTYERLVARVSTMENAGELAAAHPETADRFLAILWGGLEVIARVSPAVREEITEDFRVQWDADDADAEWYAVTDADAGSIEGGPGRIDDPDVTFTGETSTLFSMLGDDDFAPQQAFMEGAFQLEGDMPAALQFGQTMDAVQRAAEDTNE